MVFYEESPAVKKTKPTKRTPKVKKNPTDDVIDPNPPELVSPPPPVLPNESSPTSNQNDMDIDGLENVALEFQSTEETQKVGINAFDGVIDPDGPTTESPPTPVVLVETSPHADPKVMDIDEIQNSALADPHATIEDTQLLLVIPIHLTWAWMIMLIKVFLKLLLMVPNHLANKIRAPTRTHLKMLTFLPSLHRLLFLTTSILM